MLAVLPMEGADAEDGSGRAHAAALLSFAGGAGIIWFEAVAVVRDRASITSVPP